jgi:hypothetical protein
MPFAVAASSERTVETTCFVYAVPDPVGVNQLLLITYRIDKLSPTAQGTSGGDHFEDFTVTITDPSGAVTTETGLKTDSTSTGWFAYYPTQVGVYKFQAHFPQTVIVNGNITYTFKASDSAIAEVTVQSEPIPVVENNPLPTGYWTRPIYGENKDWYTISGNWLMQGYDYLTRSFGSGNAAFAPYTTAPDTAHILWTKPIMYGGIVGGEFGDQIYYQGLSYEQHYNPLILGGRIIFTEHDLATTDIYQTRCIDLYTGEDIWILPNVNILFAQVVMTHNPNEHGGVPYLVEDKTPSGGFGWGSTYTANSTFQYYDAWTGRPVFQVTNITWSGAGGFGGYSSIPGPNGELLSYAIDSTRKTLMLWNSTKAIYRPGYIDTWGPAFGSVIDGSVGIEWNVSIPEYIQGASIQDVGEGYIVASLTDSTVTPNIYTHMAWDISTMKKDSNGNYPTTLNALWIENRTGIWESFYLQSNIGSGVYCLYDESLCKYHVFSVRTGQQVWESEPITEPWASFNWQWWIAYGILFTSGYDGYVRAYNAITGQVIWEYFFGSAGYENAYGTYPVYSGFNIADGKVYITNDEHSPDSIPWRGGKLWCFDAYTGECLWNISGKLRHGAISDGYFTTLNSLDGQIYTFGKGPSKTTVLAPSIAVPTGTAVMISGTVTDQSPGAKDTAAISDKDMTAWMEYLYEQKAKPTNATGVEVKITAIGPNGEVTNIGTTTSDIYGNYGIAWIPNAQGSYQIVASFEGTKSYARSEASTYLVVGSAAPAIPTTTPTPSESTTPTIVPSGSVAPTASPSAGSEPSSDLSTETLLIVVAAVVIIVAVGAAAVLLRKRA